jgi:type IV pilus assembly protein PilP
MTVVYRYVNAGLGMFHILLLLLFLVPFAGAAVDSDPQGSGDGEAEEILDLNFEITKSDYQYQLGNRPDPFVPFYTGESTATTEPDPNEIIDVKERLTGMQLFEPGQLTLVAIMKVKGMYIAMVEDFKGQGYIIEKGTKIGRRGVVKEIIPRRVLIEEVAVTRAGKELRSETVMALRKEGEE